MSLYKFISKDDVGRVLKTKRLIVAAIFDDYEFSSVQFAKICDVPPGTFSNEAEIETRLKEIHETIYPELDERSLMCFDGLMLGLFEPCPETENEPKEEWLTFRIDLATLNSTGSEFEMAYEGKMEKYTEALVYFTEIGPYIYRPD